MIFQIYKAVSASPPCPTKGAISNQTQGRGTVLSALFLFWFSCCLVVFSQQAEAGSPNVRLIKNDADLSAAIERGAEGETWLLSQFNFSPFELKRHQVPAVIRSLDPSNPAVISGAKIQQFDGLSIRDVIFGYQFSPADKLNVRPFAFAKCQGLEVTGSEFLGSLAQNTNTAADGFGYGIGLSVRFCSDVTIKENSFGIFHRGLIISESDGIIISNNEVSNIRMDGMVFAQVSDIIIEENLIHSFDRTNLQEDHADMIQFWTASTEKPSRNITIRGNVLNTDGKRHTQSIFIRNELVDQEKYGEEMFYRNILIEDNVIINAHLHGITVGETNGLTIRHNTLVQNPNSAGTHPRKTVWQPSIRVAKDSRSVVIEKNISSSIRGYVNQVDWVVAENLLVQNLKLLDKNHYNQIFQGMPKGDPAKLETYVYRDDVPPVGAARLRSK